MQNEILDLLPVLAALVKHGYARVRNLCACVCERVCARACARKCARARTRYTMLCALIAPVCASACVRTYLLDAVPQVALYLKERVRERIHQQAVTPRLELLAQSQTSALSRSLFVLHQVSFSAIGGTFSKVSSIVTGYNDCTRALSFQKENPIHAQTVAPRLRLLAHSGTSMPRHKYYTQPLWSWLFRMCVPPHASARGG